MPSSDLDSTTPSGNKLDSTPGAQQSSQGCLVRLFWLAFGNVILLACAGMIAKGAPWSFSAADVGYWSVVLLLLAARFVDIRRFAGETANGQPATMAHFGRYAVGLPIAASAVWALAHSVDM